MDVAKGLEDSDGLSRCAAVESLGRMGEHGAQHPSEVAKRLEDQDRDVREATVEALGRMGLQVTGRYAGDLERRLKDPDMIIR